MLSRQSLIALAVALTLGIVAVFVANSFLSGREKQIYRGGTTKVAVAAAPLVYGTELTPDKVRFVDYPNSSIPIGSFTNASQLIQPGKKRVVLLPIAVNEPILNGKISAVGQGASIAALLPDGARAATVRINDISGVAGFIQPNDSVDVLITRLIPGAQQGNAQVTDVLLQNVRVIAIDQDASDAKSDPRVGKTATLEVSQTDAQKLALAQQVGSLSLALKKAADDPRPMVETVASDDLRDRAYAGGLSSPGPAPSVAAPVHRVRYGFVAPRRKPLTVEVVRGVNSKDYEVGHYVGY